MKKLLAVFGLLSLLSGPAFAQNEFATANPAKTVVGVVMMCLNVSGVAVPTNQSGACPGGGGGSGAVFGPTAVGSPAANPPILVGGTVDGTAAGNVSVWKVLSGVGFINCANCSGSGASAVDEATFTPGGTTVYAPGGGFFQTTATNNALTNLQGGTVQMTAQRAFFVNLRNSSGTELGLTAAPLIAAGAGTAGTPAGGVMSIQGVASGTAVPVSGTFWQTTQPVSGTVTANLGTIAGASTSALQTTINNTLSVNTLTSAHTCNVSGFSLAGCLGQIDDDVKGPFPVNVNGTATGMTGLTPGVAQTGTIIAGNFDLTSLHGTALGAPTNFGTTPGAVAVLGMNASLFIGTAAVSLTNPSFTKISDGVTAAKVEPASTPAAVTDPALAVAPIPSELHLGEVASNQIKVQVAQTVTASAYSAGNALGGLMTVANAARVSGSAGAAGTGGILTGLQLNSKAAQSGVQVDVFIFDANPTGSTCTDKTAFVLATADFDKVVGILTIPSTPANGAGWFSGGTGSVGIPTYFPVTYDLASSTSIYACAVVRAAITPASTSDISFKFNTLRN